MAMSPWKYSYLGMLMTKLLICLLSSLLFLPSCSDSPLLNSQSGAFLSLTSSVVDSAWYQLQRPTSAKGPWQTAKTRATEPHRRPDTGWRVSLVWQGSWMDPLKQQLLLNAEIPWHNKSYINLSVFLFAAQHPHTHLYSHTHLAAGQTHWPGMAKELAWALCVKKERNQADRKRQISKCAQIQRGMERCWMRKGSNKSQREILES